MAGLDDEARSMLASLLERFVAERHDPAARLQRLRGRPVDHRRLWPALAELGLPALLVGAEQGGLGGSAADLALAAESLAPGLLLEPVVEAAVGAALMAHVDPAQADAAAAGGLLVVPVGLAGHGGRGGADADGSLVVRARAGTRRLDGRCACVIGAAEADRLLVVAAGEGGGTEIVAVRREQPGVAVAPYRLLDGRSAADVTFADVEVDAAARGGVAGPAAAAAARHAADLWLTGCAADALGVMSALMQTTTEYLRTRVQFGVAIGTFQALQHRLADMHIATLEVRALLRAWARALDAQSPVPARDETHDGAHDEARHKLRRALLRRLRHAARRVGQEAIQMHGGMGLTEELWVSHGNARLQTLASLLPPAIASPAVTAPAFRPAAGSDIVAGSAAR